MARRPDVSASEDPPPPPPHVSVRVGEQRVAEAVIRARRVDNEGAGG